MPNSSVPAKEIIEECQTRGYLAKQLYIVSTRPLNGIGPIMENLPVHLAYQEDIHAPAWGATYPSTEVFDVPRFRSTPPRGERP